MQSNELVRDYERVDSSHSMGLRRILQPTPRSEKEAFCSSFVKSMLKFEDGRLRDAHILMTAPALKKWELLRSLHSCEAGVASNPAASLARRRALTRPFIRFRLPLRSGSFPHFSHPGRGARPPNPELAGGRHGMGDQPGFRRRGRRSRHPSAPLERPKPARLQAPRHLTRAQPARQNWRRGKNSAIRTNRGRHAVPPAMRASMGWRRGMAVAPGWPGIARSNHKGDRSDRQAERCRSDHLL
jgi:hypothetical protein